MHSRIQPFSGKQGEEDFQLWLVDYEEATNDCQWSDKVRARWFLDGSPGLYQVLLKQPGREH